MAALPAQSSPGDALGPLAPIEDRPECNFTWLVADGTNFAGSTAMRIHDGDLNIFIEAFPATGTQWDPATVTDADIIIQAPHGHTTHYDAATVATVQKNTGAYVVGNARLRSDMLAQGVPSGKIVELSPTLGGTASVTDLLGCNITAIGMTHSITTSIQVDTFYVEMPNGIRWFHGTCAAGENYASYIRNRALLDDLDMMALDFEHNANTVWLEKEPQVYIETHTFQVNGVGYLWDDDPASSPAQTLSHNTTYHYQAPLPPAPPVLSLGSASPLDVTEDDPVTFKVFYQDANDDAPSWARVHLRDDQGGVTQHAMTVPPGGSPWSTGRFLTYSAKLSPGTYDYRFEAHDGLFPAIGDPGWIEDTVHVRPRNKVPELMAPSASPNKGDTDTAFRFDVMYRDLDNLPPQGATLYISGEPYEMVTDETSGPWSDWVVYYCETTLPISDGHRYYFLFTDAEDQVRLPKATDSPNWLPGPEVTAPNHPPSLTTPLFSPWNGTRDTEFTFSVFYADGENDHPTISNVFIDSIPYMMMPDHFDFVTGARHTYRTKLDLGLHDFYFIFSDGENEVRLPAAGVLEGPEVLNQPPVAVITEPETNQRFVPTDQVPFRARDDTDPDGDELTFKWTSDLDGLLGEEEFLDVSLSEGTHVITLLVEDGNGGSDRASVAILVRPYRPAPLVEAIEVDVERPIEGDQVQIAVQVGNVGEARASGLEVTILVDGEEMSSDLVSVDVDEHKTVTFTWLATVGDHTIVARAGESSLDMLLQVAPNTPPGLSPYIYEGGAKLRPGKEIYFRANATDVEGDELTFAWDFGDGVSSSQENPSHIYAKAGTYTVTLTITDARGGVSTETLNVQVVKPKKEDSPGPGAALAALAVLAALGASTVARRRKR